MVRLLVQDGDIDAVPAFADFVRRTVGRSKVTKAGEGTFKEVFMYGSSVMAVMPIEGDVIMNSEPQKRAGECVTEVLSSRHLAALCEPTPPCGADAADAGALVRRSVLA